jgi:hypothetical protein
MDIPRYEAYGRRVKYLGEAIDNHVHDEHAHYNEQCERCANIKETGLRLLDDMPVWMYKFITFWMWIRHPILMWRADGDLKKLTEED